MLYLLRLIFVIFAGLLLGVLVSQAWAEEPPLDDLGHVSSIMKKARQDAKKMVLPDNRHTGKGQKAASETAGTFHSPEFQEQIQCEEQRLETEVFKDYIAAWEKNTAKEQLGQTSSLTGAEKIYLFLSSSVPDETVHAYLADIARAADQNLIPVMRGLIRGKNNIKGNTEYFSRILKRDLTCLDGEQRENICKRFTTNLRINPLLFTRYGVTAVPAVIYADEKEAYLIQGDAGLDYLLERINREAKSVSLAGLIKRLRGGH